MTKIDVPSSLPANTKSKLIVSVPSTEQRLWGIWDRKAVFCTGLRFEHQEWHLEDKPLHLMWEGTLPSGVQNSAPAINIWTAWVLQTLGCPTTFLTLFMYHSVIIHISKNAPLYNMLCFAIPGGGSVGKIEQQKRLWIMCHEHKKLI